MSLSRSFHEVALKSETLLDLNDLGFKYPKGNWIFRSLNLSLRKGEILTILGSNGVGKSTLLNTVLGHLSPTEGQIFLGGRDSKRLSAKQRAMHLAYLAQQDFTALSYTVLEYLIMGRAPHLGLFSSPGQDDVAHAKQVLEDFGLLDLAERPFNELSGGQQQQVGIARTLVQDAPLIVLDEPTSALDLANQAKILARLKGLAAEGKGVIMTTHSPDHALLLETRIALLGAASIRLGSADELLTTEILSETFHAPLTVSWNEELGRKTCHITTI